MLMPKIYAKEVSRQISLLQRNYCLGILLLNFNIVHAQHVVLGGKEVETSTCKSEYIFSVCTSLLNISEAVLKIF